MTTQPISPLRSSLSCRGLLYNLASSVATLILAACSGDSRKPRVGAVECWMWDAGQLPAYEACAKAFETRTGIKVNITQIVWGDYQTKLMAGFIAGTRPNIFTDHISEFAQLVDLEVLVPLEKQAAWADVGESAFQEGLIDLRKGEDGHQYGYPKDQDTVMVFYNRDMLAQAGLPEANLTGWSWNPANGGTLEKVLARLTVSKNGMRGDEPGFDESRVAAYGLGIRDVGTGDGQTQWSPFTGSADGWFYTNREAWGDHYRYDEEIFQDTMDQYFDLVDKGYMPPCGAFFSTTNTDTQLDSGKIAMCSNGSWMFGTCAKLDVKVGTTASPVGPNGKSVSLFNGLGDSTSEQPTNIDNASKWVAFLKTAEAQDIVASRRIVFPAIVSSTKKAVKVFEETGPPTRPFTQHLKDKSTFFFPLTCFGADVGAIMKPATDNLWANRVPASALTKYNERINLLFRTSEHEES